MARKRKRFDPLPWYALLDMDAHVEQTALPSRPKGRPRGRFQKTQVNLRLTEDQLKIYDNILESLRKQFDRDIARGDLLSFMTFRLISALQSETDETGNFVLPEWVRSFTDLAKYLDQIES